ncbi:CAMK family protein kinase [Histomonas meleagridis]|uniref:CAMK family protein kinase n=1 Tax=Histomonas meleagridis TaxID=135588 RepID=UPI00355A004F|nr:CAMK family protein kinase [Histomonas meleagridis]KAH0797654.1 CAMK family protein kinase [Histomonas meleagridis]
MNIQHIKFITHIPTPEPIPLQEKPICQVGNYLLVKKIGSGSFSKVYLSIDRETQKTYAVKRIKLKTLIKTPDGVNQLDREINLMRNLEHKNILKLYDVFISKDRKVAFLVLEHADKGSILSLLRKGALTVNSIRSIMKQVASALSYMHSKGYVHQDIKPANVLMNSSGKAMLGDFGIGHSFKSAAMVMGSPAFQAPEALGTFDDEIDEIPQVEDQCPQVKEDIWALGVTLYQMLFQKLPYTGENLYEIVENIREKALVIPKVSFQVPEDLIRGMLQPDPHKRYTLDQVLAHPFIRDADDFVTDFITNDPPLVPQDFEENRKINNIEVIRCGSDFMFSKIAEELNMSARRFITASEHCSSYNPRVARKRLLPPEIPQGSTLLSHPMSDKVSPQDSPIPYIGRTYSPKPIRRFGFPF